MDFADDQALAATWINYSDVLWSQGPTDSPAAAAWAVVDAIVRENPQRACSIILAIIATDRSDATFAHLAAGPLENLLAEHGLAVIDWVEDTALQNDGFRHLLGGVWPRRISPEVWARLAPFVIERW
jgi:hypothetical protein